MPKDTFSRTKFTPAFAALVGATGGATGTITGAVVDTSGYRSNTFVLLAGLQSASVTAVTTTILSGTATSSLASCADAELISTEAVITALFAGALTTPGAAGSVGFQGTDRYVRSDVVVAGAATGVYAGVWVQADAIEPQ